MEKDIVKYQTPAGADVELSVDIVRNTLCGGNSALTDAEIKQFIALCRYQGINPFLKEAYLMKTKNGECSTITSKELFLKRAENNPNYDGAESGIIVQRGDDLVELPGTLKLPTDVLIGGWAKVYRKDQNHAVYITVSLDEYQQKKADGTPNKFWREKPCTMIRKVALMQGLREAFCNSLGALYTEEEQNITYDAVAEVVVKEQPKQATKAIEQKKEGKFDLSKAQQGVLDAIAAGNLQKADNGIQWIKANYPTTDTTALEATFDAAVNREIDLENANGR